MAQADKIFAQNDVDTAKEKVLALLDEFPSIKNSSKDRFAANIGNRSRSQAQPRSGVLSLFRRDRRTGRKSAELGALDRDLKKMPARRDPGADREIFPGLELAYLSAAKIKD